MIPKMTHYAKGHCQTCGEPKRFTNCLNCGPRKDFLKTGGVKR